MNNSECCDAPLLNYNDGLGICSDCKEWAGQIQDETTMNKETLQKISGFLSEARTLLTDTEVSEHDQDIKENWLYQIETLETEIDSVITIMNKDTTQ
jgi:hypothetical protein